MKWVPATTFLLFLSGFTACSSPQENEFSHIKTPYLGQTPPKMTPIAFAPDLVSTPHYEYGGVFSTDMTEFYFIAGGGAYNEQKMVSFEYRDDHWQKGHVEPRAGQPFLSLDGETMHLGRRYKQRTETGWSERKLLGEPFDDQLIMRLTASETGTYYFDTYDPENESFPIRYSRIIDGKYQDPTPLGPQINTGTFISHPFIAPDESYLIWDAKREDGFGSSDIYISFRNSNGSWSEAKNLGDKVNTAAWEASASVTPDGKYLFFSRNMGSDSYENVDIFWVDAKVIEDFRP